MRCARHEWALAAFSLLGWVGVLAACWATYATMAGAAIVAAVGGSVVLLMVIVAALGQGLRYFRLSREERQWEDARAIRTKADEARYDEGRAA
jgi:hypothetical protein